MLDKTKEYLGYCPNEQDLVPGYIVDGEIEHIVAGIKVIAPSFHLACKKCGAWLSSNEIEKETMYLKSLPKMYARIKQSSNFERIYRKVLHYYLF